MTETAPGFAPDLFAGQRVVVTGGAGGIGGAAADLLASLGGRVVIVDHPDAPMPGAMPAGALFLRADLSRAEEITRCAAELQGEPIHALIHSAGLFRRLKIDDPLAERAWQDTVSVNLSAPYLLTRALLPAFAGHGAVVMVTSVRGRTAARDAAAYTAAKGGLAALTRALAVELAGRGIRVNAVAPGDIETPMNPFDPAITPALIDRTPLQRRGHAAEVARAIVFLASPLSSFVTGEELVVDGGFLSS